MGADALLTLGVLAVALGVMASELLSPDVTLVGALVALVAAGVVDMEAALEGFSNPALVTVGGLLVVAAGPTGLLAVVFLGTVLLTETVINNAAVALAFPVAVSVAAAQGLDPRPFLLVATVAASLSFSSPLGYQTNLMVYGPGGYRFTDFVRVGLPLQLLLGTVAVAVARWWFAVGA